MVAVAPRPQEQFFAVHFETVRLVLARIDEFEEKYRLGTAALASQQQEAAHRQQLEALFQVAMGTVRNLVATSALFLRLDYAMYVFDPAHRTERTVDLAVQRATDLERIVQQRQQFAARLRAIDKLWPLTLDQEARRIIADSGQLQDAARAGRTPARPHLDVDEAVIRILPLMAPGVGLDSGTAEEVMEFCRRERLLDDLLRAVDIALNQSFPNALSMALQLVKDDSDDYLVLSAMVPAFRAREQYQDYLDRTLATLTPVGIEHIRFIYDVLQLSSGAPAP